MKTIYKKLLFLLLLLPLSVLAQTTVSGSVVEKATGQPMPGVNINIQGATTGVSTDFDGKYKIPNVKKGDKLVFSYIGFKNAIVTYTGQADLSVSLEEDANELKEVVVQVGYGSVKKKDATGSVAVLGTKDFNKGAIVSVDQLLTGKAAGVRITNNGGQPDSAPNIRIRGGASLSASNDPLIIIDGVPISNDNPAGVSNPLSLVNPNDVESFSILKDASATAIYGVRASNGVILITTKKGTSGAPQFNYSANVSVGNVGKKINIMNSSEFVKFIQEYHPTRTNGLGIDDPSNTLVDDLSTPEIEGRIISNTDWQDQVYRTAISTDHNFSARANLYKKIPFRASFGYNRTEGLVKTNDYERFAYSVKMTPKLLDDNLKIDFNAKGTITTKNAIDDGGAIGGAVAMDPTKPVFSSNSIFGKYYQETLLNGNRNQIEGASNPLAILEQRTRPERAIRFLGNVEFDYKLPFLRDLRAVVNLGLDASESRIREVFADNSIATYRFNQGSNPATNYVFNPGENYLENQTSTNQTMDAYLAYSKTMTGFVTRVDAQGGYTYQNFKVDGYSDRYRYNDQTGLRESVIDPNNQNNRYYSPLNLQAYFARANFDILDKYLFTATFRADGSSLFQENKRWGYFPAVGAAWKLKEESFLKDSNFIQNLKLRLGWGKTGQQNITGSVGYFPSSPLFQIGNVNSQYLPGVNTYSARAFNPNITWEKTDNYNLGMDFELFKNGILSGAFDVYKRKTNDLLAVVPVPPGQGLSSTFIDNVGSIDSKGFEANLDVKVIQSEDANFTIGGNIAYNYSEVSDLRGISAVQASESGLPTGTGLFLANHAVGYQPYSAWVFQQIYDDKGQPIPNAFRDLNGDNQITNADRYYKALRPNWTYGFTTTVNYKNFDLVANFRGQIGGQVYNSRIITTGFTDRAIQGTSSALNNVLNFNDGTANPLYKDFNGNNTFSDYLLEDASFLRLDNITLGYKFAKFINSSSLRIYGSVNNVFIVTKYSGQDPENFNAIDNNFYPRPRTYTFGLSLDF
ncbi:SusC/RagA family TonB-linked outer membrane protein [Flavobacterium sp. RSSA_27]|uniref:SusC/RagA family TonB-linked outer membrane protein n=1 Tax=Flavobacterium sp. RSSA_27 TaxID=3447667 RepID=UPI003F3502DB